MTKRKITAMDLFCGAGGTSQGVLMAANHLEADLELTAINHWQVAIDTHSLNHPYAAHLRTDLDAVVDPRKLVPSGRLNLLCASPECTHHSTARGGKPMNDQSRHSGWHILRFVEAIYTTAIVIENVPEFQSWGPLGANGRPLKSKKGQLFEQFIASLRALGYKVEWKVLNCADYGDPTTRKRLFILARRDGRKIVWPEPTHVPASQLAKGGLFTETRKPWRTAREIIDWKLESRSIFDRKKPLAPKTLKRIEAGLKKFCGIDVDLQRCFAEDLRPFLVVLRGTSSTASVDDPLNTVTASGAHYGLVEPFLMPHPREHDQPHSVDRPVRTVTASSSDLSLVEPFIAAMREGAESRTHTVDAPLGTVTAGGKIHALVEPFVMSTDHTGHGNGCIRPTDAPVSTLVTKANQAVVEPFLLGQQSGAVPRSVDSPTPAIATAGAVSLTEPCIIPQFSENGPRSVDKPLGTVTTTSRGVGLMEPFLSTVGGTEGQGRHPHSVDEPLGTVLTNDRRAVAEPFLVAHFSEREGQPPRTHSVDSPAPTVTHRGAGDLVEPFLVTVNHGEGDTTRRQHSVDTPLATATGSIGTGICEPFLVAYYGTEQLGSTGEPLATVVTKDRHALVEPYITETFRLDIRFRMLQPRELARAQGFPDDYQFTGNREAVVKQIGNAVPPNTAKALAMAVLQ